MLHLLRQRRWVSAAWCSGVDNGCFLIDTRRTVALSVVVVASMGGRTRTSRVVLSSVRWTGLCSQLAAGRSIEDHRFRC